MIRQAISCDICGTEMLNANHWFVAYDHGPELRISAWSAHNRVKASARHLCGHKCLHKLVDDFMARTLNTRAPSSAEAGTKPALNPDVPSADTSLIRTAPHRIQALSHVEELEPRTQLIKPSETFASRAASGSTLRAEAWKRERQRQADQSTKPYRSIA